MRSQTPRTARPPDELITMEDPRNRRVHLRFDISLSVEIDHAGNVHMAQARNLSIGGLGIALDTGLPDGADLAMKLLLLEEGIEDEKTAPLELSGKVVWCKADPACGYQAGVRFAPIDPSLQKKLTHFLDRLKSQR
jgi:c-di-GMP-binding flagellar brake protein YcgR